MKLAIILIAAALTGCGTMRPLSDAEYQQAMQMLQRFERKPTPVVVQPVQPVQRCTWQRVGDFWYQNCF